MDDLSKLKELQAAYLCVKPFVADDIISSSELKLTLQCAGYNPTGEISETLWNQRQNDSISFSKFCEICQHFSPLTDEELREMLSTIFCLDSGVIKIEEFNHVFRKVFKDSYNEELDNIIKDAAINGEYLSYKKLSKSILSTVTKLKQMSLQKLEERLAQQRIDSRTFTKKQNKNKNKLNSPQEERTNQDFEKWNSCHSRGCFFLERDSIIAHQYFFEVATDGPTAIKISPTKYPSSCLDIDALAFLFKETSDGTREYVGYTSKKLKDGSFCWSNALSVGKYLIIPFTSGCALREREANSKDSIKLLVGENKIALSEEFLDILNDIFCQFDLDGNSFLNRQEFNLYNWRTSGEVVQDDEWNVLEENFDVMNGELTKEGFISLHQLEAEDNGGDAEDLWLSLEAIGFNRMGIQDQAAPFSLYVFCETSKPRLSISGLRSGGFLLDKAVVYSIIEEGHCQSIEGNVDIVMYLLENPHRGSIVIQNKSNQNVKVQVDCSQSINCSTNRPFLDHTVEVDKKSAIVAHQFLCKDIRSPWKIISHETFV